MRATRKEKKETTRPTAAAAAAATTATTTTARYWRGVLGSRSPGGPAALEQCVDGAARWLDMTMTACDSDVVDDWEIDELLHWSTALDFDHYWTDWQSIATSDVSEAAIRTLCCALTLTATTRYDTIRDGILTCARMPTQVSLIYRTEPTTKKV